MALANIKKIQLIGIREDKDKILEVLQNSNAFELIELKDDFANEGEKVQDLQRTELEFANLDFAIKLLSKYSTEKKGLFEGPIEISVKEAHEKAKGFDHKKIINQCLKLEDTMVKAKNEISAINTEEETYAPWTNLAIKLENIGETETSKIILGSLKSGVFGETLEKVSSLSKLISVDKISEGKTQTYLSVTFEKELEGKIRQILGDYKFTEAEFPKTKGLLNDYLKELGKKKAEAKKTLEISKKELTELASDLDDLKVAHDYVGWRKEKLEAIQKLGNTEHSFILNGWLIAKAQEKLEEDLNKETKNYQITEIEPEEGENHPVILSNSKFMSPFESVTRVYGLPRYDELDPTPFLAAYFIVFFALCLTDAGYGILMFIVMYLIQKKMKLADGVKKLVRVLMYGGIVTFVIGAIFGGWFGLTPEQVPKSLTYTATDGTQMFIFQKISAIQSPIKVLILSLILGYIQVITGLIMKLVHGIKTGDKKEAWLESGTWLFMLLGIGFSILASAMAFGSTLITIGKWWTITAAILLVLTQGREKENIIGKAFSGILSLYGIVGYLSDILSYSRLLALGLATTIIGLAVNIVANLVLGIPYIGWLLMIVVFIGGHLFNLLLNALGSFIHSGRLQFVEFFTKFMEGGGKDFKPFNKKTKYLFIKQ